MAVISADPAVVVTKHPRTGGPATVLAVVGAAFVVLQIWVYGAWIFSGDAHSQSMGSDQMDTGAKVVAWLVQLASSTALVVAIVYCARRWRREGRMPWDAMLAVAWLSAYWQEVTCNYLRPMFLYNSYSVNLGSWYGHIPGWISPNARNLPEPLLMAGPVYGYWFILCAAIFCAIARRIHRRRPQTGGWALFGIGVVVLGLMDLLLELIFIRTGMFAYSGVIRSLSLWGGKTYQFPLYEPVLIGVLCTTMGLLRYYRDDRGFSAIERGSESIRPFGSPSSSASSKWVSMVRTLALVGLVNVMFGAFNLFYVWTSLYVDEFPAYPSYLINEMCGPGTGIDCPAPGVPINTPRT